MRYYKIRAYYHFSKRYRMYERGERWYVPEGDGALPEVYRIIHNVNKRQLKLCYVETPGGVRFNWQDIVCGFLDDEE